MAKSEYNMVDLCEGCMDGHSRSMGILDICLIAFETVRVRLEANILF